MPDSGNLTPRADENRARALPPSEGGSDAKAVNLDLTRQELHRGVLPGDQYVRIARPYGHLFQRVSSGYLRATAKVSEPRTPFAKLTWLLRRLLIGKPLPSEAETHERLSKIKALAIFASDAMSSVAYATEEILFVLVAAGSMALGLSVPISLAIALLLGVVAFSYRQTVFAYPNGGGSYVVSKENIGTGAGLVAAAALTIDYILTVAVSVSAGTAAVTSAFEFLHPYAVEIALTFVLIMVIGNLRGVTESGNIFAVPTYVFIFSLGALIGVGLFRLLMGLPPVEPVNNGLVAPTQDLTAFLLLTAFSAGSVAASGTEAISNGVQAFKPPESKNAAVTLTVMAAILGVFFLGISFLAAQHGITPTENETVLSQLARAVFGRDWFYYLIQFATMTILVLAANTSFNGFPRLASILAEDGFMPHQFSYRGDRLAFSYGIVALGLIAGALIFIFQGDTHLLIPLYAVGVFLAFTVSQIGMVLHHRRVREPSWQRNALLNGFGAALTAMVLGIALLTKFVHGAWITVLLIVLFVAMFIVISQHYRRVAAQLALPPGLMRFPVFRQIVLVPIAKVDQASARALAFAKNLAPRVHAVHIAQQPAESQALETELREYDPDLGFIALESPFREFLAPLLAYINTLHDQDENAFITIVVPEFITAQWWERLLHNATARRLQQALKAHPNVAIVNVPYQLKR